MRAGGEYVAGRGDAGERARAVALAEEQAEVTRGEAATGVYALLAAA
ncbi:MAG TPA: hypothetical protein VNK05_12555 [Chloroflexota bacterium]|nr:hypothetical protein [Chloroflexota bacterium]